MHVAAILKEKGRAVETVTAKVTLREIASRLAVRRIGAVVVCDHDGGVAGIVSERDIVKALAENGADVLDWQASRVMTRNVVTARETDTVDDLMVRMTEGRFRHLPVVDENGEMLGLVSIGDAVSARLKEMTLESEALLIGWSGSFLFVTMERFWGGPAKPPSAP